MFLYILLLILLSSPVCLGDTASGGIALLKQPVGARQVAMGGSSISMADGLDTIYYNPAGLVTVNREINSTYIPGLLDTYCAFTAYGMKMGESAAIGVGLGTFQGGTIEIPIDETTWQTLNIQQDYLMTFCYANRLSKDLNYGINLKYLSSTLIEEYTAFAYALDLGLLYYIPLVNGLSAGITMQNLGTELKYLEVGDKLPLTYGVGIGYSFEKNFKKYSVSSDVQLLDNVYIINLGLEFSVSNNFSLRGGYSTSEDENHLSLGMGFLTNNIYIDFGRIMLTEFEPLDLFTFRLCF